MLRRRARVTLFGEPAWISTAEDVILHKLVWNRISPSDRQLGDAAGIVAVQADALDKNYLKQWAQELRLANELERLLSGNQTQEYMKYASHVTTASLGGDGGI